MAPKFDPNRNIYGQIQQKKETTPSTSFLSKIISFGKEVIKPTPESLEYEKRVLPDYYQGDSKIMKAITAPGTAVARGTQKAFSRLILPGLAPLSKDVAEIYEVKRKGGIADQVASGKLPPEVLKDFEVLNKTSPQIVGDVAQAVLSVYGGGAATRLAKESAKKGITIGATQLAKTGALEGTQLGALFGLSQAASKGEQSKQEYWTTLGLSTVTGGLLGGIISGAIPVSRTIRNKITKAFEKPKVKLPVTSSVPESVIPIKTPKTKQRAYAEKMGYEPYTPESELPVIEMGTKPKDTSGLPVIDYETGKQKNIISKIIEKGKNDPEIKKELIQQSTPDRPQIVTEEPIRVEPKRVTPEGDTIVPALAKRTESAAVEKNLVSRFEGLPEEKTMNMKQQADEAMQLVDSDYEKAKRVAMGKENPPGNLRDASVYEAVKYKALQDGDVDTLRRLATESTVPSKLTAYGQEIKAADSRLVDTTDPVELMQEVIKSRKKPRNVKKKDYELKLVQTIYDEVKPKKNDWVSFINSIEC